MPEQYSASKRKFLDVKLGPQKVLFFNSLLSKRVEVVSFRVNSPNVVVVNDIDKSHLSVIQISPIWPNSDGEPLDDYAFQNNDIGFDKKTFELLFEVEITALSTRSFTIQLGETDTVQMTSQVSFYHKHSLSLDDLFNSKDEK